MRWSPIAVLSGLILWTGMQALQLGYRVEDGYASSLLLINEAHNCRFPPAKTRKQGPKFQFEPIMVF